MSPGVTVPLLTLFLPGGGDFTPPSTFRQFSPDVLIHGGSNYTLNSSFVIAEHMKLVFHVPKRMLILTPSYQKCRAVALFMYYNSHNFCMYICVIYLLYFNYNSSVLMDVKVLQMSDSSNQYFPICKLVSVL